jgi:hypothetical protein
VTGGVVKRFRYSYNVIGYGGEEISHSVDRVARLGFDAIEVEGEPGRVDPDKVKKVAQDAGLEISSVCPSFTAKRDLSHPDPRVRDDAKRYVRGVAELAHALGAPTIIVAPTAYPRTQPLGDPQDEWRWAVESIRAVGEYASSLGVDLALECWNRYGTYMLNRLEQGVRMWRETGLQNGGVMADTFHMNIEERSPPRRSGRRVDYSTTFIWPTRTVWPQGLGTLTSSRSCAPSLRSTTADTWPSSSSCRPNPEPTTARKPWMTLRSGQSSTSRRSKPVSLRRTDDRHPHPAL